MATSLCGCVGVGGNSIVAPIIPETEYIPELDQTDGECDSDNVETENGPNIDGGNGGGDDKNPENSTDNNKGDNFTETEKVPTKKAYAVSTTNGLRVRSLAKTSASVLGSLDKNDAVMILGEENGFYKTIFKEKTAYVYSAYCSVMEVEESSIEVEKAIDEGAKLLGHPYVWGSQRYHWGNGKLNTNFVAGEYDCSALTLYVYYKSNKAILDVTSRAQSLNGEYVPREKLSRGDLMFFTNASRKDKVGIERIGHVGIYFGNNYILHTASDHAVIEPISSLRWSYYITARRIV